MSLTLEDLKKIAHLARLNLSDQEAKLYGPQLSNILNFVAEMNAIDTTHIEAVAHPFDIPQRLRADSVTEPDLRAKFQAIAPQVEAGLYLIPKVIDEA